MELLTSMISTQEWRFLTITYFLCLVLFGNPMFFPLKNQVHPLGNMLSDPCKYVELFFFYISLCCLGNCDSHEYLVTIFVLHFSRD